MSCNESERGTIELTKTGYMQIIRTFRDRYNAYINTSFEHALAAHAKLSAVAGAKCAEKRRELFQAWRGEYRLNFAAIPNANNYNPDRGLLIDAELLDLIESELFRGKDRTLTKPRRSAFPKLINKDTSFSVSVSYEGGLTFELGAKGGVIRWHVSENNHAVRTAHDSPVYALFVRILNEYTWKRNEGGEWYHDDEYMRDGAEESGSSYESSVSASWGPLGKKYQQDRLDRMSRMWDSKRKRRSTR